MHHERRGEGTPLLLLHPFATSHVVWRPVIDRLAHHHDVLALTLPGFGGSPRGDRVTMDAFVDHVERELDAARWSRVDVVGNSLGGFLALKLAERGRARSVTAIAPAGGWERWSRAEVRLGLFFLAHYPVVRMLARFTQHIAGSKAGRHLALRSIIHRAERVSVDDARATLRAVTGCDVYLDVIWHGFRHGLELDARRIDCPVRLLLCEHDRVLPHRHYNDRFIGRLPSTTIEYLGGVGHVPMLEEPDLVVDAIVRHLAEVRGQLMKSARE
jgi:pimeloyl-ACP methyl ester carboxylesterase